MKEFEITTDLALDFHSINGGTMVSFPHDNGAPFGLDSHYAAPGHTFQAFDTCKRCHVGGCDVKVLDCGCFFHAVSAIMKMLCALCEEFNSFKAFPRRTE